METTTTCETPKPESVSGKISVTYIAVVEKFGAPNEKHSVDFVNAKTRKELNTKLNDPMIANVMSIIKGRKIEFKESRQITF